jgi:hypothetical protein
LSKKEIAFAESLAVRRDMVTLLNYIKENHPVGTQSTGNLQLKAVREVCAQFTDPPKLERTIGDYHYQVRSEADVRPLFYLHMLAATGGLAAGGQARCLEVNSGRRGLPEFFRPNASRYRAFYLVVSGGLENCISS